MCTLRLRRTRPFPLGLSGQRSTWFVADGVPGTGNKGVTSTRVGKPMALALRSAPRMTLAMNNLAVRWNCALAVETPG